ncbi:MAG: Hsp20/alpha crystallin family protein [Candidatus Kerfeldbacteria bacterium]|nr:Hsp20/alpha crystallin family protein [Candidatus Kerfeldbacteria bacterium]
MNIIRWRPMMGMDRWFDDMGMMGDGDFLPAVDVYQTADNVVVEAPLAGVDPDKVNISIENDVLTIEGSMEKKTEVDEKNYYRKEIRTGMFHRSVALPVAVNGDKANATFEKGMLKVSIPKAEHVKPKTIKVNVTK